ncbi:MAG: SOS response-associated peptidase family protein [Bacteroidales bacterium]
MTARVKVYSFSIITATANKLMAEIHNSKKRMPVIINHFHEEAWLYTGTAVDKLRFLMTSYPDGILDAHTISPMIGNTRIDRNRPEIIKPYSYPTDQTLF